MAVRIGCDMAAIAELTKDESKVQNAGGVATVTYGAISYLKKLSSMTMDLKKAEATVDADNGTEEVSMIVGAEGKMKRTMFTSAECQKLFNEKKFTDGINVIANNQEAKYFAFGWREKVANDNGNYVYFWLLKAKFSKDSHSAESAGNDKLTPQEDEVSYKATTRDADGSVLFYADGKDDSYATTWFSSATLLKLESASTNTYAKPAEVEFVTTLPTSTNAKAGVVYINSTTNKAYYWDGTTAQEYVEA